ncbi:DUF58 domain-containing protein [Sphingomonas sp. CJ99]
MILPTQRAVVLVLAAAPVALLIGVLRPDGWTIGLAWVATIALLTLLDGLVTPGFGGQQFALDAPATVHVGEQIDLVPRIQGGDGPGRTRFAVEAGAPAEPVARDTMRLRFVRRGTARLGRIWARRAGPLGLGLRQTIRPIDRTILVLPDLTPVRDQGMRQVQRSGFTGNRLRPEAGDGMEFQTLTDFQPGMARRSIDWKASARMNALLAREYRPERENNVVFAIDAGRAMSDPVGDLPRIDRAVSAALLAGFVALKSGDRARLFGFAARPSVDSGTLGGARGFTELHRAAAALDYGTDESNYTLSLVTLDQRLERRSLVILFTESADPTGAELMFAAVQRLKRRHRVLVLMFRDVELETLVDRRPNSADDVVRATIAQSLLRERRIVVERLKRSGIDVIEAAPDAMPLTLVERYLAMRERA